MIDALISLNPTDKDVFIPIALFRSMMAKSTALANYQRATRRI